MEFKVPKRHILRLILSTNMGQYVLRWERKKRCSSRKTTRAHGKEIYYNISLMIFFGKMKLREDKQMIKLDESIF
jgi:hypothetical protein